MRYTEDSDLATLSEDLIAEMDQDLQEAVELNLAEAGERPYGVVSGSILQQLEQFVAMRDDPLAWAAMYQQLLTVTQNEYTAQVMLFNEDTRLNRLLAKRGGWTGDADVDPAEFAYYLHEGAVAVVGALTLQRAATAAKDIEKAEKILALPPAVVTGPLPQVDALDFLTPPQPDLDMLAQVAGEMGAPVSPSSGAALAEPGIPLWAVRPDAALGVNPMQDVPAQPEAA